MKRNLKGLSIAELEEYADSLGEKKFRGRQLFDWLYNKEVDSFGTMSTLSRAVRERLAEHAEIQTISLLTSNNSMTDGTVKYLFQLSGENQVECVLIPPKTAFWDTAMETDDEQARSTLCISTQAGCPLDCHFCATATMGFNRNLSAGEILDQYLQVRKITGKRISNIVYMGMGEPFLNYDNVLKSVEIFITGMNIAARHITISTAGWIPGILRLAEEPWKTKLAISLHATNDRVRSELMPVNRKYPLPLLLDALQLYYKKVKRRVTFEYILFDGINDRDEDLKNLVTISRKIPSKVNIIPFHPIPSIHSRESQGTLRPTPQAHADDFVESLRRNHITVFVRSSSGEDIAAACGQLAVKHTSRKQRHSGSNNPHRELQGLS